MESGQAKSAGSMGRQGVGGLMWLEVHSIQHSALRNPHSVLRLSQVGLTVPVGRGLRHGPAGTLVPAGVTDYLFIESRGLTWPYSKAPPKKATPRVKPVSIHCNDHSKAVTPDRTNGLKAHRGVVKMTRPTSSQAPQRRHRKSPMEEAISAPTKANPSKRRMIAKSGFNAEPFWKASTPCRSTQDASSRGNNLLSLNVSTHATMPRKTSSRTQDFRTTWATVLFISVVTYLQMTVVVAKSRWRNVSLSPATNRWLAPKKENPNSTGLSTVC